MTMYEDLIRSINEALAIDAPAGADKDNKVEEDDDQFDEVFEFSPDEEG